MRLPQHSNLLSAALLCLCFVGCALQQQPMHTDNSQSQKVPPALHPYIDQMHTPLNIMELPDYIKGKIPDQISKQEALEDINVLRYLFDNAFSGRHYWQQNGVDFPKAYAALKIYVDRQPGSSISTKDFENEIFKTLDGINDPHTAIIGHETQEFFKRVRQYFSNFVIEKNGDKYIVIQSNEKQVPVGAVYVGDVTKLFPTLSATGKQHFLFGRMDTANLSSMTVELANGKIEVSVHACRIGAIRYDRFENIIEISSIDNIPVVRSSSFWVEGKIKELEQFSEYGKNLRNHPYFIWNLLANDGGITQYPAAFIENFNDFQQDESWEAHLHSTPIAQAYLPGKNTWSSWPAAWLNDATPMTDIPEYKRAHIEQVRREKIELIQHPQKFWEIVKEKPAPKLGNYQGKVVILSNHRNGSAGNNALAMSKSIPNSLIVGENSNMTYAFANTRNFSLKHSRIKLRLPGRLIINPANSMERGFLPDLWLDSATPVQEVVRWLKQPATYQFTYRD